MENGEPAPPIAHAHCNSCGGKRNSFVRATYMKRSGDEHGAVDWWDTYEVLECCGCGSIIVRHEHSFSEDTDMERDPETGEWREVPRVRTAYYPAARIRPLPRWFDDLKITDALLADVLSEVYAALQDDSLILATAGARVLLDRAMFLLLGSDVGTFAQKLDMLVEKGMIGREDRDLLAVMTDAGNAAAHRGYRPPREHLETILDTIENLLHRKFVLEPAAASVKAAIPQRPRRGS